MTRINRYPLYATPEAAAPENTDGLLKGLEHGEVAPKTKDELVTKAEELASKIDARMKHTEALIKNAKTDATDDANLKATLGIMNTYLTQLNSLIQTIKDGKLDLKTEEITAHSDTIKSISNTIDTFIDIANKRIQAKFAPGATTAPEQTPGTATQEQSFNLFDEAGKVVNTIGAFLNPTNTPATAQAATEAPSETIAEAPLAELKLPSEIFATLARPLPRTQNETPLEKTKITEELNTIFENNDIALMSDMANTIRGTLDSAIRQLATKITTDNSKDISPLADKLGAYSNALLNATDKTKLFDALLEVIRNENADNLMKKAISIVNAPEAQSNATPEKKPELKDLNNMTEAEKQAMLTALSNQVSNVNSITGVPGKKPAELTLDNIKKGVYVGELFRTQPDGTIDKPLSTDFTAPNSIEQTTLKVTGPNTFTYRNATTTFTVERRNEENINSRTKDLPADVTSFLSQITRLSDAKEKAKYLDPIIRKIQDQLGGKVYISILTKSDKTGTLTIKQIPEKDSKGNSNSNEKKPTSNAERVENNIETSRALLKEAIALSTKLKNATDAKEAKEFFEQGLKKLDDAIALTPNMPELHLNKLRLYIDAGNLVFDLKYKAKEIIASGKRYLALTNGDTESRQDVMNYLSLSLSYSHDLSYVNMDEAISYSEQAVNMEVNSKPANYRFWKNLLELYVFTDKYAEAKQLLKTMREKKIDIAIKNSNDPDAQSRYTGLVLMIEHQEKNSFTYDQVKNSNLEYSGNIDYYLSIANDKDLPTIRRLVDERMQGAAKEKNWSRISANIENMLRFATRIEDKILYTEYLEKGTKLLKENNSPLLEYINLIDKAISSNGSLSTDQLPIAEKWLKSDDSNQALLTTIIAQTYLINNQPNKAQQYMGVELPKYDTLLVYSLKSETMFNAVYGLPFQRALFKKYYGKHMTISN